MYLRTEAGGSDYFHNQRERWKKCDNKSQAKLVYGRLKADIRQEKYLPKEVKHDITLKAWILRCHDGSTNKGLGNEKWAMAENGRPRSADDSSQMSRRKIC